MGVSDDRPELDGQVVFKGKVYDPNDSGVIGTLLERIYSLTAGGDGGGG